MSFPTRTRMRPPAPLVPNRLDVFWVVAWAAIAGVFWISIARDGGLLSWFAAVSFTVVAAVQAAALLRWTRAAR